MKRRRTEPTFPQQAMVFIFGTFSTARAPEHIQVAQGMRPVLVADARRFRHQSFHQQECPILWQGLAAIPQNDATAPVAPIVNHTFQDDGIRPGGNRLKETPCKEASTAGVPKSIKMTVGDRGASGEGESVSS